MKRIAVVTATRAEYGLISPVLKCLRRKENDSFRAELIVTGTHLHEKYGNTIDEIKRDGVRIDHIIHIPVDCRSDLDISNNQAEALRGFTALFMEKKYEAVLILGDRYEMLSVAIAAGNTRTPVFHLCGGDTTEGAQDEWIRHAITKISYLHFVTNEQSRKRVIQLGEDPSRVFNYGSTSIDNVMDVSDLPKDAALERIGLPLCAYALCTYHPVTMEDDTALIQLESLLEAIKCFPEIEFIITKSNADKGGEEINAFLDAAEEKIANIHVFSSLGAKLYLSLMRHAEFVIGNSSSGVIETPAFGIATVNIGDRQQGRLRSESVIDCSTDTDAIISAVKKACSAPHRDLCRSVVSPYGRGGSAARIADKTVDVVLNEKIDLKKKFYDL